MLMVGLILTQAAAVLFSTDPEPPATEESFLDIIEPDLTPLRYAERAAALARFDWRVSNVIASHARAKGVEVTTPKLPDVTASTSLAAALTELAIANGKSPPAAGELAEASRLPPSLSKALTLLVVSAQDAGDMQRRALAGLSIAEAEALLSGELDGPAAQAALEKVDMRESIRAALLMDAAVERTSPTLRVWSALLSAFPAAHHKFSRDYFLAEELLSTPRPPADSLRAIASLAGRDASYAAFKPRESSLAASLDGLYRTIGVPQTDEVRTAVALSDAAGAGLGRLVAVNINALTDAMALERKAFASLTAEDVSWIVAEEPRVSRVLGSQELASEEDARTVERALELVRRADLDALTRAASTLLGAGQYSANQHNLGLPDGPGPLAPSGGGSGQPSDPNDPNNTRVQVPGTQVFIQNRQNANGSRTVGVDQNGDGVYEVERTGPAERLIFDLNASDPNNSTLALVIFNDENGDALPQESEVDFRTAGLRDPANDVRFKDPFGFVIVGGEGRTSYDKRYGKLTYDLLPRGQERDRTETYNLTLRQVLTRTSAFDGVARSIGGGATADQFMEDTLVFPPNVTINPGSFQFLTLDLGGDDSYVNNIGGTGDRETYVLINFTTIKAEATDFKRPSLATGNMIIANPAFGVASGAPPGALLSGGGPVIIALPAPPPYQIYLPMASAALAIDLGGNDTYRNETKGNYTIGSANFGVGVLYDRAGNDTYASNQNGTAAALVGVGVLVDEAGSDAYIGLRNVSANARLAGLALLHDGAGDDVYVADEFGMAVGISGVAGLFDLGGDDAYSSADPESSNGRGYPAFGALVDYGGEDTGLGANGELAAHGSTARTKLQPANTTNPPPTLDLIRIISLAGDAAMAYDSSRLGGVALDVEASPPVTPGAYASLGGATVRHDSASFDRIRTQPNAWTDLVLVPKFYAKTPGILALGSEADTDHVEDSIIDLDLGGNDHYTNRAAAAGLDLNATTNRTGVTNAGTQYANVNVTSDSTIYTPVALLLDVGGSDRYDGSGRPNVQGSGVGGIGLLYDIAAGTGVADNDVFVSGVASQGSGSLFGVGVVHNSRGDDTYAVVASARNSTSQGYADTGGIGLLIDLAGSDTYNAKALAQGSASGGFNVELGLLVDGGGLDSYSALERSGGYFNASHVHLFPYTLYYTNSAAAFYTTFYTGGAGFSGINSTLGSSFDLGNAMFVDVGFDTDSYNATLATVGHKNDWNWTADGGPGTGRETIGSFGVTFNTTTNRGRGYDDPAYYANFVLSNQSFSEYFRLSRGALFSPAVVFTDPVEPRPTVEGAIRVEATATFGLAALALNSREVGLAIVRAARSCVNGGETSVSYSGDLPMQDLGTSSAALVLATPEALESQLPEQILPAYREAVSYSNCRGFAGPTAGAAYEAPAPLSALLGPRGSNILMALLADSLRQLAEEAGEATESEDARSVVLSARAGVVRAAGVLDHCTLEVARDVRDCAFQEAEAAIIDNTTAALEIAGGLRAGDVEAQKFDPLGRTIEAIEFLIDGKSVPAAWYDRTKENRGIYAFEWNTTELDPDFRPLFLDTTCASDYDCRTYRVTALAYVRNSVVKRGSSTGEASAAAAGDRYGFYPGQATLSASVNNPPSVTSYELHHLRPGHKAMQLSMSLSEPASYHIDIADEEGRLVKRLPDSGDFRSAHYGDNSTFRNVGVDSAGPILWDGARTLIDLSLAPEGNYTLIVTLRDVPPPGASTKTSVFKVNASADYTPPIVRVLSEEDGVADGLPCHAAGPVCMANMTKAPDGQLGVAVSGDIEDENSEFSSPIATALVYVRDTDIESGAVGTWCSAHGRLSLAANWCFAGTAVGEAGRLVLDTDPTRIVRYEFIAFGVDDAGNCEEGILAFDPAAETEAELACQEDPSAPTADRLPEAATVLDLRPPRTTLSSPSKTGSPEIAVSWEETTGAEDIVAFHLAYNISGPGIQPVNFTPYATLGGSARAAVFEASGLSYADRSTAYFLLQAEDAAGNRELGITYGTSTLFDLRAPAIQGGDVPADLGHSSATLRWNTDEAATSSLELAGAGFDGANYTSRIDAENDTQGLAHEAVMTGLAPGAPYHFRICAGDNVGNRNCTADRTFTTSTVISMRVLRPVAGEIQKGDGTFYIVADTVAVDNFLSMQAKLSVDGGATFPFTVKPRHLAYVLAPSETAFAFDTVALPDTDRAVLRLIANNSANSDAPYVLDSPRFIIDNGAPTTVINLTGGGAGEWRNATVLVSLLAGDASSGIANTLYSFDNATFHPYVGPLVVSFEGVTPIYFYSVDRAEHSEGTRVGAIKIDRTPPFARIEINEGARATSTPEVRLELTARDSLSGLVEARVDAGGDSPVVVTSPELGEGLGVTLKIPRVEGPRIVSMYVSDAAGNALVARDAINYDTKPPVISNLRVDSVAFTSAVLTFTTDEDAIASIDYRDAVTNDYVGRSVEREDGRSHSLELLGLQPGASYELAVSAVDLVGNIRESTATVTTMLDDSPPRSPATLAAEDGRSGFIRLAWTAAADNVGILRYSVLRSQDNRAFAEVGQSASTVFIDDSVEPAVPYYYKVAALDLSGNEGPASRVVLAKATTAGQLLSGAVTPAKGDASTVFTYSVLYRDQDGDPPLWIRVAIDGHPFEMRKAEPSVDFRTGVRYEYKTKLAPTLLQSGLPTYHFEAPDAGRTVRFPQFTEAVGPAVLGNVDPPEKAGLLLGGLVKKVPGPEAALFLGLAAFAALGVRRRR